MALHLGEGHTEEEKDVSQQGHQQLQSQGEIPGKGEKPASPLPCQFIEQLQRQNEPEDAGRCV